MAGTCSPSEYMDRATPACPDKVGGRALYPTLAWVKEHSNHHPGKNPLPNLHPEGVPEIRKIENSNQSSLNMDAMVNRPLDQHLSHF